MAGIYDVIIIGGGPAGYTAGRYAARGGLNTLLLEKLGAGGQMNQTTQIDNYPGFDEGIDGFTLGDKMRRGAEQFGLVTKYAQVNAVDLDGDTKTVVTSSEAYQARSVIIATGADHRHLGLAREQELTGRGLHYCAACDGNFYRGKTVAVVGGGNSAAADALLLSRIAKKVIVIHRRNTLRATKIYHQPLMAAENVEFLWNSEVSSLKGEEFLTGVAVIDRVTGQEQELSLDGLFISVGRTPNTALFAESITLDSSGYILADESTRTNLPGVVAIGDVRAKEVRQIITAAADGAVAAHYAQEYLA